MMNKMKCPICVNCEAQEIGYGYFKCPQCFTVFKVEGPQEHKGVTQHTSPINWNLVKEQMTLNKKDRFDWKKIIGMSLTRAVAKLKEQNLTPEQIYEELSITFKLSDELKRRLKIGIAARIGESKTYESEKL